MLVPNLLLLKRFPLIRGICMHNKNKLLLHIRVYYRWIRNWVCLHRKCSQKNHKWQNTLSSSAEVLYVDFRQPLRHRWQRPYSWRKPVNLCIWDERTCTVTSTTSRSKNCIAYGGKTPPTQRGIYETLYFLPPAPSAPTCCFLTEFS